MSQTDRIAIIDEFGKLDAELEAMKPKKERHAQLRELILGWYEKRAATHAFTEQGKLYSVEISARANEREIRSMSKVYGFFGLEKFLKLCTFPLKVLDQHMPVEERKKIVAMDATGERKLKAIPKFEVQPGVKTRKAA